MITTFWNLLNEALSKGLLHMFSANYLTQILAFGSLIFVSKVLTPEELGAVKIIQGYIAVCTIFALLGRHTAIIKFCAETKDVPQRNNILKQSMISSFFASIVIIFFGFIPFASHICRLAKSLREWRQSSLRLN